jgi:uncharacterized membrane protein (GlpM family)
MAVVYLGSRLGGILVGTPMLIFPLFALQTWFGPPVTQSETLGSISSITAVVMALWSMWLPYNYSPLMVLLTTASCWAAAATLISVAGIPAVVMSVAIAANAMFILSLKRDRRVAVRSERSKLTEAAIPTAIFLFIFFAAKQFVPDFVRGIMAVFPTVMLATLYFVRSTWSDQEFRSFVRYSHSAVTATAIFIITVHFSLGSLPISTSLLLALLVSIVTSVTIGLISRTSHIPSHGSKSRGA